MTTIGVAGDDAAPVTAAIRTAGGEATADSPDALAEADVDVLIALGEDALTGFVTAGATAPVLPVETGPGVGAVRRAGIDAAIETLLDGTYETTPAKLLDVRVNGTTHRALADVMLVTAEPARISEFGIHTPIEGARTTVATVRADGIVVATPRGSHGYAKDARGPILAPGADTVSVVPIAPFRINRAHWGLTPPVTLSVERDETDVTLLVDGVDCGFLDPQHTLELAWGDPLPLVRVSASEPYFRG